MVVMFVEILFRRSRDLVPFATMPHLLLALLVNADLSSYFAVFLPLWITNKLYAVLVPIFNLLPLADLAVIALFPFNRVSVLAELSVGGLKARSLYHLAKNNISIFGGFTFRALYLHQLLTIYREFRSKSLKTLGCNWVYEAAYQLQNTNEQWQNSTKIILFSKKISPVPLLQF